MESQVRVAEHRIKRLPSGRYDYRLKYMVVGDYIKLSDWDKYTSLSHAARSFGRKRSGWDFHMGNLEDGTPVMWRIS